MLLFYCFLSCLFFTYDHTEYENKLKHVDYQVREFATWQLNKTNLNGVGVLLKLVDNEDPEVRIRIFDIYIKKYLLLNDICVKNIQKNVDLEAFLFYTEPGQLSVSKKFAIRVVDNPELACAILKWGYLLGVCDRDELFHFDPKYLEKTKSSLNVDVIYSYSQGGLCVLRARAAGQPYNTDPECARYIKFKPLIRSKITPTFPLIDIY